MQQSPFENIFNIIGGLSEGNEKPMKHGFYNAFALFILAVCCAAFYVLFLILEPFFKPLFWALLVGSLLHPFKYKLSKKIKSWFEGLEKSNSSVIYGLMIIPVNVVNYASDTVGHQFKEHYKTIIGLLSAIFILPWVYSAVPRSFACIFWQFVSFVSFTTTLLIKLCSSYITLTFALAYIISVYFLWSPSRAGIFRMTSHILWLVIASFLANLAGSYKVYMFIWLQAIGITGFVLETLYVHKQLLMKDPETSVMTAIHAAITNRHLEAATLEKIDEKPEETIQEGAAEKDSPPEVDSPLTPEQITKSDSWTGNEPIKSSPRKAKMLFKTRTMSALPLPGKMPFENRLLASFKQRSLDENYIRNNFNDDETALYFKLLFFGCFCMLIWKYIWLLPVMLFFLVIHIIKISLNFFGVWLFFENQYNNLMAKIGGWWNDRKSALVPAEIRGIRKMLSILNRGVIDAAYESVDTVSTFIVIIALIFIVVVTSIFIFIQIYSEAIVVVQLGGSLLNSTFVQNSELHAYLPEGWEEKLDSLIDNAYTYGREGISTGVKSILKEGDPEKIARVEQQVLELWDRVYQSWVSGTFASQLGPQVDGSAVQDSWDNLVNDVSSSSGILDYSGLIAWLQANVGTLSAIATGMWAPLASNVSLLAGSVGAFTSLLLCGGGAIINMIINLVVFFTTLFYLLASSNALYKPVEVITRVQPNFGPKLGIALSVAINQDFVIHLKDFYTDQIHSITVQNCRDLRVVLDCPILQRPSRLQKLVIKDCDRLEFVSLSSNSLLQTPPEVRIENVREIVSFPRNIFKSPNTNTELKCMGAGSFKKLHVINSKINSINTRAIYNVSGIKSVEFENVTIADIQTEGIAVFMGNDNTLFSILNSKIENMDFKAVTVQSFTVKISSNVFADVIANAMNISSNNLFLVGNTFREVCADGITTNSVNTDVSDNTFEFIKSNALANVKCSRKRSNTKRIDFLRNTFRNVEPYSLYFDHASCKAAGTQIAFRENKIDCRCRNISFLNSATHNEQNNLILDLANNNTCLVTYCTLPIEVVKLLMELDMCHLNLDPQVMCLLYNDKQSSNNSNNEVTTDDEVTEPAPTFYLIRQANTLNSDTGAAMTAIDKDDLLKDNLNLTNRTLIKFVFDSSKDFVETLRSTSRTRNRPTEKSPQREEYVSHCIGTQCRNDNVYNRQRALDFYKYVYAQLRTPRQDDNKLNKM